MTRPSFYLCLSAFSLLTLSAGSALAQTPDIVPPAAASGDTTQKSSQSHQDAAGLALLGVVVGGAALMGGGGHGSGDPSSISANSSFVPSATAPQMIYTQAAPSVPSTAASMTPVVLSTPIPEIVRSIPAAPSPDMSADPTPMPINGFAPASPVVLVTYPIVDTVSPIAAPIVFSPPSPVPQPLSSAPVSGLTPVAAVPEPGTTAALALGSLLLGGLLVRARRSAAC